MNALKSIEGTSMSPYELTDEMIRNIGKDYLAKRKTREKQCTGVFDKFFHNNQAFARSFANYQNDGHVYEKWLFLAECFAKLPTRHGELAVAIFDLFDRAFPHSSFAYCLIYPGKFSNGVFNQPLTAREMGTALKTTVNVFFLKEMQAKATELRLMQLDVIDNAMLQKLGEDYINCYPKKQGCLQPLFKLFHDHHEVAKNLKNYCKDSTPIEKWYFLAEQYAKLNKSKGALSDAILLLFQNAFEHSVCTQKESDDVIVRVSPQTVAEALRGMVCNAYTRRYFLTAAPSLKDHATLAGTMRL